jgi:hypothetical protein
MKRASAASLKRVTAQNLTRLGAERLAEILLEVAETRVELKRRLRMELAAEQGAAHLLPEIDRRLGLLASSRSAVSWRQKPAFVRDLDGLRGLIAGRLADLDLAAAQDRIGAFLRLAAGARRRVRDGEGALAQVFAQAAADAVALLARAGAAEGGAPLAALIAEEPAMWSGWAGPELFADRAELARTTLGFVADRSGPGWGPVLRRLADAARDPEAFAATFTAEGVRQPEVAAQVAQRFLASGQLEAARRVLEGAVKPSLFRRGRAGSPEPDFDWESAWIDYLDAAGRTDEAQAARWASFERTLSPERGKAFTRRLPDFEDVEAEERIFATATAHPDAERALQLLMDWPALPEAARLIVARADELHLSPEQAEGWARKLRRRYPAAAERLLRCAAAEAFRRREFPTATRLTQEADSIAG